MKIFFLARLELYSFGQSKHIFTSDRNICSLRIHTVISCTSPCTEHIPQFQVINKQCKNVGALHLSENLYQRFKAFVHLLAWVLLKRAPDGVYKKSMLNVLPLKRELRCLRHKIHIGLFSAFALSSLNWILTNSSVEELVSLILANSLLEELVSTYPEYSPSIYISSWIL